MSETNGTLTPNTNIVSERATELTGTHAAVYTQLLMLTEEATASELAVAAGLGRSTTSKVLVSLESRGLAIRVRGGHDGPRRVADLWHAAPTNAANTGSSSHIDGPDTTQPEFFAGGSEMACQAEINKEAKAPSPDDGTTNPDGGTEAEEPQDGPQLARADQVRSSSTQRHTTISTIAQARSAARTGARLAPGGLRQLVVEHLQAHPDKVFTATRISRAIARSSGAIANALITLTKQGITEQVGEQPRTYRLTTTESDSK